MSIYRLRRELVKTSSGPITVQEFTVLEWDIFYSISPEKRLSLTFPGKKITPEEKEKLFAAIKRVNAPLPPPEKVNKKNPIITLDEAITYICETSPGEKRQELIKTYSRRQIFYWLKTSGDLRAKLHGEDKDNLSAEEFDGHMGEVEKKLQGVPEVTLDEKIKFFAKRWGKTEEEVRREWKPEKIESAWKNHFMDERR